MAILRTIWNHRFGLLVLALFAAGSSFAVQRFHKPGQLDVISAQAMDMSEMRPPSGAAPVELASVTQGSLQDSVTYTGTVQAYNEQVITSRITGRILTISVYPGDSVHAGQIVAQLDTQELSTKTAQADAMAEQAQTAALGAELTHHLHHPAALELAADQVDVAKEGVLDAEAQEKAAGDGISEANAEVVSAQAQADYWKTELAREKQLADAGAASTQEYQNELAQASAAAAALTQAAAKRSEAQSALASSQARTRAALRQTAAAKSALGMAHADIVIAGVQVQEAQAGSAAASAAAQEAGVEQGYGTIVAPVNAVVVARSASPGTLVDPGMPILTLAEMDRVRVQANVAVDDLAGISVGSPVQISLSDGAEPIHAFVSAVFPSANEETRTAVVEADIPNLGHVLLPGAFVTMNISRRVHNMVLEAPADSVVTEGGESYVWVALGGSGTSNSGKYRATGCGLIYSAADAKKYHYVCPMDHSKIVPIASTGQPSVSGGALEAHRVGVTAGASDGVLTELTSSDLHSGDRVVRQGQAGLSEGSRLVETAWGPNGPMTLPTAAQAAYGEVRFRCEICGLTFSAADAAKDGYHDPMDGGKLVPIQ